MAAVIGPNAMAQVFNEVEANDNKALANLINPIGPGFSIVGNSTGTSTTAPGAASSDNFRINMFAAPLGIYQHRLTITSQVAGHTGTLRGLNQTGTVGVGGTAGTLDTTLQTSSTATSPARFNQWYGFGKQESLYYRVTGTASTTADYTATHSVSVVVPLNAGIYNPGMITINTVGVATTSTSAQVDTDLWVYDSGMNAIPGYGNDDHFGGTTLGSTLTRNYAPGVYTIAISNFQTFNNQPAANDDDFVTGSLADFPNWIGNSSTTTNMNMSFSIGNVGGAANIISATKVGPYDVVFASFVVVPEPATMIALGAGITALVARRRRK
jgi:hypothetical protein